MSEPIKNGDVCLVVDGIFGQQSPNVGKQVTVHGLRGEHSVHGRIWRCAGKDLVTEYGSKGNSADFAQAWLQKLPPDGVRVENKALEAA